MTIGERPVRRAARAVAVAVCVAAAACSDGSGPPPLVGHHELMTVNGFVLPTAAPGTSASTTMRVLAGDLWLGDDGSYVRSFTWTPITAPDSPPTTSLEQGLWTLRDDGDVDLDPAGDAAAYLAVVTATEIVLVVEPDNEFAFRR